MNFTQEFEKNKYEIEDKFNASSISMDQFCSYINNLPVKPNKTIEAKSWDYYFSPVDKASKIDFIRYRQGEKPELTVKFKLEGNGNRIEYDIPLDPSVAESEVEHVVSGFTGLLGFKLNFKIFKFCVINYFDKVCVSYYISFNENLKEVGRYLEVEAIKDAHFDSIREARAEVEKWNKLFEPLGINETLKISQSQFELNRR